MIRFSIPVVPARGGAEVALDLIIRPFSSIEFARAVRRAWLALRPTCCAVAVQECDRRATTLQCNIKRTFSWHFTLHSSHPALHASHVHFTFHSSFYLKSYFKSSDFSSPSFHLILTSSHLIPSLLTCPLSKFFSTDFFSSEHWKKVISTQLSFPARQKALTVRKKSCAQKALSAQSFCAQKFGHRCI